MNTSEPNHLNEGLKFFYCLDNYHRRSLEIVLGKRALHNITILTFGWGLVATFRDEMYRTLKGRQHAYIFYRDKVGSRYPIPEIKSHKQIMVKQGINNWN